MPGLIAQGMSQAPQAEQSSDASSAPREETQGANSATPEEQQAKDQVVAAGMQILYDKKRSAAILEMLKAGAGDESRAEQALAQVVVLLIRSLDQKAQGSIPRNIILPAAGELIALVAEFAEKAGLFQADEPLIAKSLARVMDQFAKLYGVKPQEVQAMLEQIGASKDNPPEWVAGSPKTAEPSIDQ